MSEINSLKLAVLIDADNAQASVCENLLKEIARFGTAHIKRIYGDWTQPNLKSWKEELKFSFQLSLNSCFASPETLACLV